MSKRNSNHLPPNLQNNRYTINGAVRQTKFAAVNHHLLFSRMLRVCLLSWLSYHVPFNNFSPFISVAFRIVSEIYNYSTKTTDVTFLTPLILCCLLQVPNASAPYWFDHVFMIDMQFQREHLIHTIFICSSARLQLEIIDSQISARACEGNVQNF